MMKSTSLRLPVLMYHALDDGTSPLSTAPDLFRRQIAYFRARGWSTLTLGGLLTGLRQGNWPPRTFVITFDDGFAGLEEHALPFLADCGFSAIVFVVAGYAGQRNDWPGQARWVRPQPLLGWPALRRLAAGGWEMGAHTCTHAHLTRLPAAESEQELAESKAQIEDALDADVQAVAYPYGEMSSQVEQVAARYFRAGFATTLALVGPGSRRMALERIDMFYLRRPQFLRALVNGQLDAYLFLRRWLRSARQVIASGA